MGSLIAMFMGANMGSIWGQQDPGGPHVDPMNLAIWEVFYMSDLWKLSWIQEVALCGTGETPLPQPMISEVEGTA